MQHRHRLQVGSWFDRHRLRDQTPARRTWDAALGLLQRWQPLPQEPVKRELKTFRLEQLGRFLLRGLRIGASTVSIVELLRNDWTGGISAGVAWLVFLQVERRLPPLSPAPED
jgi:hypothetical protein